MDAIQWWVVIITLWSPIPAGGEPVPVGLKQPWLTEVAAARKSPAI